jgi:uncharacterized protein
VSRQSRAFVAAAGLALVLAGRAGRSQQDQPQHSAQDTAPANPQTQPQDKIDPLAGPQSLPLAQMRADSNLRVYAAVITHDHATLASLLQAGDSPDRAGRNFATPLSEACRLGDLDSVQILLKAGARIDLADRSQETPLFAAVRWRHPDLVAYLLSQGAPVDSTRQPSGETALFEAVGNGSYDILTLLLDHGANVNLANRAGQTPLMIASLRNDSAMVQFLRGKGAVFSTPGQELLFAASHGDVDEIRRTLAAGAKVNESYQYGVTPLMAAAQNGQTDAVKALLRAGASVNGFDSVRDTPLMYAIKRGRLATVLALLDAGADPTLENVAQVTTLNQAAIYLDDPGLVRRLIASGVPYQAGDKISVTPLMDASIFGHVQTVTLLLGLHVPVNLQSQEGLTALSEAAIGGNAEIVRLLLQAGADPSVPDKKGKVALDYAQQLHSDDTALIELLQNPPPPSAVPPTALK